MLNKQQHNLSVFLGSFIKNLLSYGLHLLLFFYFRSIPVFGEFFLIYFILKTLQVVSLFGTNRLIIRFLPTYLNDPLVASNLVRFSYLIMLFSTLCGIVISYLTITKVTNLAVSWQSLLIIGVNFLLINFSYVTRTVMRALKKQLLTSIAFELIIDLLVILIPLSLLIFPREVLYILNSSALLLSIMINFQGIRWLNNQFSNEIFSFRIMWVTETRIWFKEAFLFMLQSAQKLIFYYINFFVLAVSHGVDAVGIYSLVWMIFRIANMTNKATSKSSSVLIAENQADSIFLNKFKKQNLLFRLVTSSIIYIIFALLLATQIHTSEFILLTIIFYFSLLFNCFNSLSITIFNNTGNTKSSLKILLYKNIIKLILSQLLIIYYDTLGAGMAFLIAQIITCFNNLKTSAWFKSREQFSNFL